jgi:hypothetical protein
MWSISVFSKDFHSLASDYEVWPRKYASQAAIARFLTLLCEQLLSSISKCVMIHIKELRCLAFVSTGYNESFFKIEFFQGFLYGSKIYT